jgi:CDP-paratose 2-epimerase
MVRILVTGSAGFIGGVAYETFVNAGHEVIGLDWRDSPRTDVLADVSRTNWQDNVGVVDYVLHCAAQTAVTLSYDDPELDCRSNAIGAMRVARFAADCNAGVIYTSTNKVFGSMGGDVGMFEPVSDRFPIAPSTPYGITKFAAECYVREYVPDRSWVLRQSCIYGETQRGSVDQGWVAHLARQSFKGLPIDCYGDGTQIRDLLHVDDLVRLFWAIIEGNIRPGTYTVGRWSGQCPLVR